MFKCFSVDFDTFFGLKLMILFFVRRLRFTFECQLRFKFAFTFLPCSPFPLATPLLRHFHLSRHYRPLPSFSLLSSPVMGTHITFSSICYLFAFILFRILLFSRLHLVLAHDLMLFQFAFHSCRFLFDLSRFFIFIIDLWLFSRFSSPNSRLSNF